MSGLKTLIGVRSDLRRSIARKKAAHRKNWKASFTDQDSDSYDRSQYFAGMVEALEFSHRLVCTAIEELRGEK